MQTGEIIIYKGCEGDNAVEVKMEGQMLWLSQRLMAEVFDKDADTIGFTLKIFTKKEGLRKRQLLRFSR